MFQDGCSDPATSGEMALGKLLNSSFKTERISLKSCNASPPFFTSKVVRMAVNAAMYSLIQGRKYFCMS